MRLLLGLCLVLGCGLRAELSPGPDITIQKRCFTSARQLAAVMTSFRESRRVARAGAGDTCGTFVYFPHFTFLFSEDRFLVSLDTDNNLGDIESEKADSSSRSRFRRSVVGFPQPVPPARSRGNLFRPATNNNLSKAARNIPSNVRVNSKVTALYPDLGRNGRRREPAGGFERLGRHIENFKIPGFPSLKDIRKQIEQPPDSKVKPQPDIEKLTEQILQDRKGDIDVAVKSLLDMKDVLENSTSGHINNLKHSVDDFRALQLSILSLIVEAMTPPELSDSRSQVSDILDIIGGPSSILQDVLENLSDMSNLNSKHEENMSAQFPFQLLFDHLNTREPLKEANPIESRKTEVEEDEPNDDTEEVSDSDPFPTFPFGAILDTSVSELGKIKEFVDRTVADNSNMTVISDTLARLGELDGEEILGEINERSKTVPFLHETINSTQELIHNILPLEQIEADVSRAAKYLLDDSATIPEKVLNAKPSDFETFHLYHHLKNASESFAEMKLPGLPSMRELADIPSLELPEIPNLVDIFDPENGNNTDTPLQFSSPARSLLNNTISGNELLPESDTSSEKRNPTVAAVAGPDPDNQSAGNKSSAAPWELPALDLGSGLDNLVTASRILPRLIPFVLADYKDQVAGWLEGTEVGVTELADIHATIVAWHKHLEGIRSNPYLPDDVRRVLEIVEENNIGMLNLILHLMFRAAMGDTGTVSLTKHDLQLLDKYLLRPEQVFPVLNDYILL